MKAGISFRRMAFAFALLWTFLVLYPRPTAFGESIYRLFQFPGNPSGSINIAYELPADLKPYITEKPNMVEEYILQNVPYKYDWQVYNLPWYFPTTEEAFRKGMGDCKTRLVILVSTFERLHIPYEVYISPFHVWINYEGKRETRIENKEAALFSNDGEEIRIHLPEVDWRHNLDTFWEAFWVHMPPERKVFLISGLSFSLLLSLTPGSTGRLLSRLRRRTFL